MSTADVIQDQSVDVFGRVQDIRIIWLTPTGWISETTSKRCSVEERQRRARKNGDVLREIFIALKDDPVLALSFPARPRRFSDRHIRGR
jgi:hypothetical protein